MQSQSVILVESYGTRLILLTFNFLCHTWHVAVTVSMPAIMTACLILLFFFSRVTRVNITADVMFPVAE